MPIISSFGKENFDFLPFQLCNRLTSIHPDTFLQNVMIIAQVAKRQIKPDPPSAVCTHLNCRQTPRWRDDINPLRSKHLRGNKLSLLIGLGLTVSHCKCVSHLCWSLDDICPQRASSACGEKVYFWVKISDQNEQIVNFCGEIGFCCWKFLQPFDCSDKTANIMYHLAASISKGLANGLQQGSESSNLWVQHLPS